MTIPENSLFAALLRSHWSISVAIGTALALAAAGLLPRAYVPLGLFASVPFFAIGGWAGWKQLRAPGAARVAATLEALRRAAWPDFSEALAQAFRDEGYEVTRTERGTCDFELRKSGRLALVSCKRWKAARVGVEPLRELRAAREAREAQECIYLASGEISDTARRYAEDHRIRLMDGAELVRLLPRRNLKNVRAP